jgi:predicted tellurium resistance membrane protein TerC
MAIVQHGVLTSKKPTCHFDYHWFFRTRGAAMMTAPQFTRLRAFMLNRAPTMNYLLALATDPAAWAALITLVAMEIVLGIDNLMFIAILSKKLPQAQRARTQRIGILLALALRLGLLGTVAWLSQLTQPVFSLFGHGFSWRDLILIGGGLFLVWKATREIHHHVMPAGETSGTGSAVAQLTAWAAIGQILMLDLVFSVDSIITAVGMTQHVPIMVVAVIAAVTATLFAAQPLTRFIDVNPAIVTLALSFLLVIGMTLIADGFGSHVPPGYIYAAMAFSAFVEAMNMLVRRARPTVSRKVAR